MPYHANGYYLAYGALANQLGKERHGGIYYSRTQKLGIITEDMVAKVEKEDVVWLYNGQSSSLHRLGKAYDIVRHPSIFA